MWMNWWSLQIEKCLIIVWANIIYKSVIAKGYAIYIYTVYGLYIFFEPNKNKILIDATITKKK